MPEEKLGAGCATALCGKEVSMKDKKDSKGRNNINKKDHQLKETDLVDKSSGNKSESRAEDIKVK